MTDTKVKLADFDGKQVVAATIAVRRAGDGLSAAMEVEPREYHHGQRLVVLLEVLVTAVEFKPLKDGADPLVRKHVLTAGTATVLDDATAAGIEAVLEDQRESIRLFQESQAGVQRLPGVTTSSTEPQPPAPRCERAGCGLPLVVDPATAKVQCPTHGDHTMAVELADLEAAALAGDRAVTDIRKARQTRRAGKDTGE